MLISFAVSKKQEEIYKLFRNLDKCCTSLQGKQNNILNITFLSMWNLHLAEPLHQQSVCNAILFCVTSISYRQHQLLTNLGILKWESLFGTEPHFPHQIQSVRNQYNANKWRAYTYIALLNHILYHHLSVSCKITA